MLAAEKPVEFSPNYILAHKFKQKVSIRNVYPVTEVKSLSPMMHYFAK